MFKKLKTYLSLEYVQATVWAVFFASVAVRVYMAWPSNVVPALIALVVAIISVLAAWCAWVDAHTDFVDPIQGNGCPYKVLGDHELDGL